MKPFDLQKALEGHKLITRDKRHKNLVVKQVNLIDLAPYRLQVGDADNTCISYISLNGRQYLGQEHKEDLFLQEDSDLEEEKKPFIKRLRSVGNTETSVFADLIHEDENFLIYKKV